MRPVLPIATRKGDAWQVLLVLLCSFVYLAGTIRVVGGDSPSFDTDEAQKLSESYYYHLFFEEGAWRHPDWRADFYARMNPPVAKYIMGAALAAAGIHVHDRRLQDEFDLFWRTPDLLRRMIPDRTLGITRRVSAAYGALVCALLFWIGRRVAGAAAGLLAALLLLSNPLFVENAGRGLTDTILLFHVALIVPVSLWSVRALREQSGWGTLLAMAVLVPAIVVALATGSKLNGALTGPVYAGSLLVAAVVEPGVWRRGPLIARSLLAAGLTAAVAIAILAAVNPAIHDHPVTRLVECFDAFGDLMVKQQIDPGPALLDLRERAAFVGVITLGAPGLALSPQGGWVARDFMVVGFCLGLATLVGTLLHPRRSSGGHVSGGGVSRGDAAAVLCWVVGVAASVTLWMPVAWLRYTLPPALPVALAAAIGLAVVPRVARLLVDAIRRVPPGAGPLTALAAVTAVGALAVGVRWVADPMRLDPRSNPDIERPDVQRAYLDLARSRPQSLASQQHAGVLYALQGRDAEAADRFETALGLIPSDPTADEYWTVRRSILLFDLARVRSAAGDRTGTLDALREHVTAVRRVRAALGSSDPRVLAFFDDMIAEREAMAAGLKAPE